MYKPLQLVTASECGLTVPQTLVTNLPETVSTFAERSRYGVVGKTFGANTVTEDGALKIAYTYKLHETDFSDLRGIAATAHQIQDWIEKKHEARVVVVGERIFAVTIHAHSESTHIDWRADFDALTYELVDAPEEVNKGLRQYMTALGLSYAAFDFCIDQDGRWIFLESNSGGQYAWLEEATGAPINQTLLELLAGGVVNG
jgi:glutathione synthase/RimK-type ligase-like ATP-grasp enzyme